MSGNFSLVSGRIKSTNKHIIIFQTQETRWHRCSNKTWNNRSCPITRLNRKSFMNNLTTSLLQWHVLNLSCWGEKDNLQLLNLFSLTIISIRCIYIFSLKCFVCVWTISTPYTWLELFCRLTHWHCPVKLYDQFEYLKKTFGVFSPNP